MKPNGNIYPWGDSFDGQLVNYCDTSCSFYPYSEFKDSSFNDGQTKWGPVGSYPAGASWCGALDMSGNVWEWVSDRYDAGYYAVSPDRNPQGPSTGEHYVRRGGSWSNRQWQLLLTSRRGEEPSSRRIHWIGFRCVVPQQRLTTAEVLKLADQFAAEKQAKYETFDLKFYPNRSATYNPKAKKWFVHYMREPNRWPGDHFSINVDDTTGELKFIGGR